MISKPKVCVIGLKGLPSLGGASKMGESLIFKLVDKFEFTVYSTSSFASQNNYKGIKQHIFKSISNKKLNTLLYYFQCLLHSLFFGNFDIIHLHHGASGFIVPFLRLKYPVITTYHGIFRDNYKDPKFSMFVNLFLKISQNVNLKFSSINVSVSKPDYDYLVLKKPKIPIEFIPNGVLIPNSENIEVKEEFICFAANRIYGIKGLDILLKALKKLKFKNKLLVLGDLSHSKVYEKEIEKLSIGLNVEFMGLIKSTNELNNYIKKAKFFVFPSITEGMSMMLLEVASLKVPIIASDIPANKSVFEENDVLFFESNNEDSLASKICILFNNETLQSSLSMKAYNKIIQNHSWERISLMYEILYKNLIKI